MTRVLVRAERALAERLTDTAEWRTERVRQVLPHLRAAVGSRPKLPTAFELERVRYTPITLPFKQAALLSHRIASRLGYSAADEAGAAEGILVDVAELWELFVLNCARRAIPSGLGIEHGTTLGRRDYLVRSKQGDRGMGRLKPDVLVMRGDRAIAVIDAKYKRLAFSPQRRMVSTRRTSTSSLPTPAATSPTMSRRWSTRMTAGPRPLARRRLALGGRRRDVRLPPASDGRRCMPRRDRTTHRAGRFSGGSMSFGSDPLFWALPALPWVMRCRLSRVGC